MRPSPFLICGMVLAATTVVSMASWFVDPSEPYVDPGLGTAGAVAAGLGWAAHASTVRGGARRGALVATVLGVAVGGAIVMLFGRLQLPIEMVFGSGPRRIYEYEDLSPTGFTLLGIAVTPGGIVFAVAIAGFVGAAARWAVGTGRHRVARAVAGAFALTPVLLETAWSVVVDVPRWTAICVLSLTWLVWAMRRARSQRRAVADIGMMGPVPIDPGRG